MVLQDNSVSMYFLGVATTLVVIMTYKVGKHEGHRDVIKMMDEELDKGK